MRSTVCLRWKCWSGLTGERSFMCARGSPESGGCEEVAWWLVNTPPPSAMTPQQVHIQQIGSPCYTFNVKQKASTNHCWQRWTSKMPFCRSLSQRDPILVYLHNSPFVFLQNLPGQRQGSQPSIGTSGTSCTPTSHLSFAVNNLLWENLEWPQC